MFLYCSAHSENRKAIMSSLKPSFDTIMTHKYTNHGLFQNNLSLVCVFFIFYLKYFGVGLHAMTSEGQTLSHTIDELCLLYCL